MKKLLRNLLLFPTLFTSIFSVYQKMLAVPIIIKEKVKIGILLTGAVIGGFNNNCLGYEYKTGKLEVQNYVCDIDFIKDSHYTIHYSGGTEDFGLYDRRYGVLWGPFTKKTKTVSIIPGYELLQDGRPLESFTPVNLELAIHTQWEGPFTFPNVQNELRINLPYDFGSKPLTLWERNIIDPNNNPNDPNNYTISLLADIKEAIAKQEAQTGGYAVVPLPDLNGTYGSQVPYFYAQIRFDKLAGDLNLDGKVGLDDFAYFAQDWTATDVNSVADISGPNGLHDKNVNAYDLSLFARDYLKDANDPNTWSRVR